MGIPCSDRVSIPCSANVFIRPGTFLSDVPLGIGGWDLRSVYGCRLCCIWHRVIACDTVRVVLANLLSLANSL